MSRWWRAYDEAIDDPKIQLMPAPLFKVWFNLMCLASANSGHLPSIETIAFKLRTTDDKAGAIVEELISRGLLDEFDGTLRPHNWDGRQYKSDVTDPTAAERMRRYRNNRNADRNAHRNDGVSVTPPRDRVQNTDTEREESKNTATCVAEPPGAHRVQKRKRKSKGPLPDDYRPPPDVLAKYGEAAAMDGVENMRNWAHSKDEWRADWDATLRNILKRDRSLKGGGNRQNGSGVKTAIDARIEQLERQVERENLGNREVCQDPVRLLPDGRGERSGDLYPSGGSDPFGLSNRDYPPSRRSGSWPGVES